MKTATSPSIRRNVSAEAQGKTTPEVLYRDAIRLLDACGVSRSHSWVSRTVRAYCYRVAHTGFPFGAYLLNRVELTAQQRQAAMTDRDLASLLCYSDPTGETAVRNVLRS